MLLIEERLARNVMSFPLVNSRLICQKKLRATADTEVGAQLKLKAAEPNCFRNIST